MNAGLFWRTLALQTAAIAALFAVLVALPLREGFFEDWGIVTGPTAWTGCSLLTARLLSLPLRAAALAGLLGGGAGAIAFALGSHGAGLVVALLVFAASCASDRAQPAAAAPEPRP